MGALAILKLIGAFLRGLPWQLYAALGVGLLLLGIHHAGVVSGRHEVQAKFDAHLSADRGAEAVAKQRAQRREESDRAVFAVIGSTFDQEKTHAAEKGRAVADGVRAGTVRLRPQWRCPAGDLSGPAAGAETATAGADLRAADSGRLVRIGAEADAQVTALQAVLAAERAKPIAK